MGIEVTKLTRSAGIVTAETSTGTITASQVILTVPANKLPRLVSEPTTYENALWDKIRYSKFMRLICSSQDPETPGKCISLIPVSENAGVEAFSSYGEDSTLGFIFGINPRKHLYTEISKLYSQEKNTEILQLIASYYPLPEGTLLHHLQFWDAALPKFYAGYSGHVVNFWDLLTADTGTRITYAGDYLCGPYIKGAVVSGERAAQRVLSLQP